MPLPVFSTFSNCLDRTRSRVWLVASELEVQSSKCSMSYRRRLKRDLLGARGCWGLVGVREKKWIYCCRVLAVCSTSMSSRPVAMANLIVARTASVFGVHASGSDGAFPLGRRRGCLFLCLSVLAFVFGMRPISCIGRESA